MNHLDIWSRRLGSGCIYWPACLAGVSLIALAVLAPEAEPRLAIERQCAVMETEVAALKDAHSQLAAAAHALENDPAYIEAVAVRDQNVRRPGEEALPLPQRLRTRTEEPPAAPAPALPPIVANVARFTDPRFQFGAMVVGVVLLAVGVVFSLPTRSKAAPADNR